MAKKKSTSRTMPMTIVKLLLLAALSPFLFMAVSVALAIALLAGVAWFILGMCAGALEIRRNASCTD